MPRFAFAHPGKIGDLLYILPTVHKICNSEGGDADIYTSEMCRAVEKLFRYQEHIHDFIIPPEYKIRDEGQGVQPWDMPVPNNYERIYQLGYKCFPHGPLHQFTAHVAGVHPVSDPYYLYPDVSYSDDPYVVVAHCVHRSSSHMYEQYKYFIDRCPIKTIQIGTQKDYVEGPSVNMTGLDLLETTSIIAKARAFVGFYSASLVLANGFLDLPKIITMWPGVGEQHGLHLPKSYDLAFPTGESIYKMVLENI